MRKFLTLQQANSLKACVPIDMIICVEEVLKSVDDDDYFDKFVEITYQLGSSFKSILVKDTYTSIVESMKAL